MRIEVSPKPTSTGAYRYDVYAGLRSTHGFRASIADAQHAAREDARLLFAAASDQDEDGTDQKDSRRRRERE